MTVTTVSLVSTLLVGCVQMQLQSELQSSDKQVRKSAVAKLQHDDLWNVLHDSTLKDATIPYGNQRVVYSTEVKLAVIDRMYEEKMLTTLIALADDHHMGGGKLAMIQGDSPITQAIKDKFRTPEGLTELCNRLQNNPKYSNAADGIFVQWLKESGRDTGRKASEQLFCSLWLTGDDAFFTWIATHLEISDVDTTITHKGEVGEEAIRKISDAASLAIVAQEVKSRKSVRVVAAKKLFNHANVTGDQILAVITSFSGSDEESLAEIAEMGLKAAKRIGATKVVQSLESK